MKPATKKAVALWRPIKTARRSPLTEIDLWLVIHSGALTMGMGDSFRVANAFWLDEQPEKYRKDSFRDDWNAGWFHRDRGISKRLRDEYITHWMPIPKGPKV